MTELEMINDPAVIVEIAKEWSVLTSIARRTGFLSPGAAYINLGDDGCRLGLVLAHCSLDEVLKQFRKQCDLPRPKSDSLGGRMQASREPGSKVKWVNFDLVHEGKKARNDLAHEAKLPSREDCMKYIDAIGVELRAWKIIP